MKKTILLNSRISSVIAAMGHTDGITISDCGLPIADEVERIDLAVVKNLPPFFDVLDAVLQELCVERIVVASELLQYNPYYYAQLEDIFSGVTIEKVPHNEFKKMTANTKAVIRTGECTPYANVILYSGTTF